uniref:type II TA system antitoxin MqsA family protein n=1 Tax=Ruegeria arenilitoris TaxID=1173585 RepID=UPI00147E16E6|nr:type II TA system antitoxin MqsA family protein [Ruegeria arenilitoris]
MSTIEYSVCPLCGENSSVEFVERTETVRIRGEEISVSKVLRKCTACAEEYENTKDHDWRREAYDKYREIVGIPSSEEIRSWREVHNLTQSEVSALLGWGEATIGRYEKGSLPTVAQADQLKRIMTEVGLLALLEEKLYAVAETKRESLIDSLKAAALPSRYRSLVFDIHFTSDDKLNGGSPFSFEKAASIVRILCAGNVTKTKLNKLVFYADFIAKKCIGQSISGMQYARVDYGPVPEKYETLYEGLAALEVISVNDTFIHGYNSKIFSPGTKSFEDCLTDTERNIALAVRNYFYQYNATDIVEYSHKEKAWLEVSNGRKISYDYSNELKDADKIIDQVKIS